MQNKQKKKPIQKLVPAFQIQLSPKGFKREKKRKKKKRKKKKYIYIYMYIYIQTIRGRNSFSKCKKHKTKTKTRASKWWQKLFKGHSNPNWCSDFFFFFWSCFIILDFCPNYALFLGLTKVTKPNWFEEVMN